MKIMYKMAVIIVGLILLGVLFVYVAREKGGWNVEPATDDDGDIQWVVQDGNMTTDKDGFAHLNNATLVQDRDRTGNGWLVGFVLLIAVDAIVVLVMIIFMIYYWVNDGEDDDE